MAKRSKKATSDKREVYVVRADLKRAKAAKAAAPFTITVVFLGGLTTAQKNAFKYGRESLVEGDRRRFARASMVNGEVIDDVLIHAEACAIDGPGGILGQAGPTHLRPACGGANVFFPAKGCMSVRHRRPGARCRRNGTLTDVITHEMGHVHGHRHHLARRRPADRRQHRQPDVHGKSAKKEYGTLKGTGPTAVPVENTGGPGTGNGHWRDTVFGDELMSGFSRRRTR